MAMLICLDVQGLVEQHHHLLSSLHIVHPLSAAACPSSPVQLELEFSLWNQDDLITRFHESWMWKGYASGVQLRSQYFVGHWTPSVHQLVNQIQFYDNFSKLILISSTTFANSLISPRLAFDVCIIDHEMSWSLVVKKNSVWKMSNKEQKTILDKVRQYYQSISVCFIKQCQSNVNALITSGYIISQNE